MVGAAAGTWLVVSAGPVQAVEQKVLLHHIIRFSSWSSMDIKAVSVSETKERLSDVTDESLWWESWLSRVPGVCPGDLLLSTGQ